jgi:hypothetical protein
MWFVRESGRQRIPRDWTLLGRSMVVVWIAVTLALIVLAIWTWTHTQVIVN